jgi:hypothetical protein
MLLDPYKEMKMKFLQPDPPLGTNKKNRAHLSFGSSAIFFQDPPLSAPSSQRV